jgi:hypothetical protein
MKTVVIHQPDFLPYLGFFDRFLKADLWVVFDNVQFLNNSKSWHNRDKIKTPQGEKWITVSVKKCAQKTPINEVLLSDTNWKIDILNLLKTNYRKAASFNEIFPYIEELFNYECETMLQLNLKSIYMLMELFDIKTDTELASSLDPVGKSNELLVDILQKVKADQYLSGVGARAYFDPVPFSNAGIEIIWQDFKHPIYPQLYGNFIPYLSSIDLLFNCGIKKSRKILRSCS